MIIANKLQKIRNCFPCLFFSGKGVPNEISLEPREGDQLGGQESQGSDGDRGGSGLGEGTSTRPRVTQHNVFTSHPLTVVSMLIGRMLD